MKKSRPESIDLLKERIAMHEATLSSAMRRVVHFMDENRVAAIADSASELATRTGTSDATVVRAAKALGFSGLAELRRAIAVTMDGGSTPARNMVQTFAEISDDAQSAIDMVLDTHIDALAALRSDGSRAALSAAVGILHPAGRIMVFGIGQTAPLARYAAMLLCRSGRRAAVCDASGIALADQLLDLQPADALLLLAYGRAYPEVTAAIEAGESIGLPMVLLSDSLDTRLARRATVVVPVRRGRSERAALHAATLAALEAIALALASSDRPRAIRTLVRLGELRARISSPDKRKRDVGTIS